MTPGMDKIISLIDKTITVLDRRRRVPLTLEEDFKERLCITFVPLERLKKSTGQRRAAESRTLHVRKRAHEVYLEILDESPRIYLPFILSVSPQTCRPLNSSGFLEQYNRQHPQPINIQLDLDAKALFTQTSEECNFSKSGAYKKLIRILFPIS
jgi:hypothetical protein